MEHDSSLKKLRLQENPRILIADIDGTLFSADPQILTAPFYNFQTTQFLKARHIPFVLATGRSDWMEIGKLHLRLLGLPLPDVAIVANGSIIYHKESDRYIRDFAWESAMHATKIVENDQKITPWNKLMVTEVISSYLKNEHFSFSIGKGNTFIIRIRLNNLPVQDLIKIKSGILFLFPKGVHVSFTEKLLWKNTLHIFSGELLITPEKASKESAVQYILGEYSRKIEKPIHADIFGDALVDVGMLTIKDNPKQYFFSQYLVHPTPLAKQAIENMQKKGVPTKILISDGPKEILWTLRPELKRHPEPMSGLTSRLQTGNSESSNKTSNQFPDKLFSPAQNNSFRKAILPFEKLLDKLIDKNLSPNEISFLGLEKMSLGLSLLHKKNPTILDKTKGLYHYAFGNLTDVLDGIRARNSNMKEENGQLVDGFSDRAKEFIQLFQRAKKRIDNAAVLETLLAALSCALPSIARAEAEITGLAVPEKDEKGGSMIDRTKRLFMSLLLDNMGTPDQSLAMDKKIYETNIATFRHRLSFVKKFEIQKISVANLSDFQKKALERFFLYVDVLQQEDSIIKKYLPKRKDMLKEYEKQSQMLAKNYLVLPIAKLRKKYRIRDYRLEIKKYLN